jgi:hypothetical protein
VALDGIARNKNSGDDGDDWVYTPWHPGSSKLELLAEMLGSMSRPVPRQLYGVRIVLGLFATTAAAVHAQTSYSVVAIPAPKGFSSVVMSGLNDSGQVAGYGYNTSHLLQAFIGTTAGSTAIPLPPGWGETEGYAVNASGQVAGWGTNAGNSQAFIGTTAGSKPIPLPAGFFYAIGLAVNDSGQVTGYGSNAPSGPTQAFIGTTSGSAAIPLPAGWYSAQAHAVNASGHVAGVVANAVGNIAQAFIGTTAGSTPIPLPADFLLYGVGLAVNDSGQVAGWGYNSSGYPQAFIGTTARSIAIPLPLQAYNPNVFDFVGSSGAINDSGVVVLSVEAGGSIWDSVHGTQLLNNFVPPGWNIRQAISINNLGQIFAQASYNDGATEYVLLTPSLHGIDLSTVPSADEWFNLIDNFDPKFVIADAWGGQSECPGQPVNQPCMNPPAPQILSLATAGIQQAAYLLLNYDDPTQPGAKQVCYAREALGATCHCDVSTPPYACQTPQPQNLAFMAVDIEPYAAGESLPTDPVSIAARVERIYEAVQAVELAGLNPVIYSSQSNWNTIAGNTHPSFGCLPLWNPRYDGSDDITSDFGQPWQPFGGWTQRAGKQYCENNTGCATSLGAPDADLDVFNPSVFSGVIWGMALDVTSQVSVVRSGYRLNHATGFYVQTVVLKNVGSTPIQGPISLALDALSPNALLANGSGTTSCTVPAGSSYINVSLGAQSVLPVGQSASVTLNFFDPSNQGIVYAPRVLAGPFTQ